jgi:hypothetical protein
MQSNSIKKSLFVHQCLWYYVVSMSRTWYRGTNQLFYCVLNGGLTNLFVDYLSVAAGAV